MRESKVNVGNSDYYTVELCGPILPHTIHSLCSLLPKDCSMTATFANIISTEAFCKVNVKSTGKYYI